MVRSLLLLLCVLSLALVCQQTAAADDEPPAWEKRVLFAPLEVPSAAPRDDGPTLFLPALFRPPIPWLKLDDRYESFVGNVEIQAELAAMEKVLLNPFTDMGRELTAGIRTEIGAYGEVIRTYEFGGGRFEFSTSGGAYGRPGAWAGSYDYESWLGNSTHSNSD